MTGENAQKAYKGRLTRIKKRTMKIFWAVAIVSFVLIYLFIGFDLSDRAGGGGGGGGGGGFGGGTGSGGEAPPEVICLFFAIFGLLFMISVMQANQEKQKLAEKAKQVDKDLETLMEFDPSWDKEKLMEFTKDTFRNRLNVEMSLVLIINS